MIGLNRARRRTSYVPMRQEHEMSRTFFTRLLALCLVLAGVLALAGSGAQAQDAPTAETQLRGRHAAVQQIMRRPARGAAALATRKTQLNVALGELLDYAELARRALGTHEAQATPAQRVAFADLLRQLVERSYQKNLEGTLDYEIRYVGSSASGSAVTVRTIAKSRANGREPEVSIDYSLHQVNGVWRVYDVATDGVSLVRTYRDGFHRIIARDGFDALLTKMRERLANEGAL